MSDFEQGEIGPDLFRHACIMGLEGLVSKHRARAYRAGPSFNWVKVKNPKHPAMARVKEAFRNPMTTVKLFPHEESYEVRYSDGRASVFFYHDDNPGRRSIN